MYGIISNFPTDAVFLSMWRIQHSDHLETRDLFVLIRADCTGSPSPERITIHSKYVPEHFL